MKMKNLPLYLADIEELKSQLLSQELQADTLCFHEGKDSYLSGASQFRWRGIYTSISWCSEQTSGAVFQNTHLGKHPSN